MARDTHGDQTKRGNPNRTGIEPSTDPGDTPREVGVTTRNASGKDGDIPRDNPGRPTSPIGTDAPDDGAPTEVENFAPREATPPTVVP